MSISVTRSLVLGLLRLVGWYFAAPQISRMVMDGIAARTTSPPCRPAGEANWRTRRRR